MARGSGLIDTAHRRSHFRKPARLEKRKHLQNRTVAG